MRVTDGGCAESRELEPANTSELATVHIITRIPNVGKAMATFVGWWALP
jgi:hypothetical protein